MNVLSETSTFIEKDLTNENVFKFHDLLHQSTYLKLLIPFRISIFAVETELVLDYWSTNRFITVCMKINQPQHSSRLLGNKVDLLYNLIMKRDIDSLVTIADASFL